MKLNKAHTATINRIARRYGAAVPADNRCDLQTAHGFIGVETAATVGRRIRLLKKLDGPAYIAVTNKEALCDALRAAQGSRIGVMDPQGNIVKMAEENGRAGVAASDPTQNGRPT
jgi:hypothetical protein